MATKREMLREIKKNITALNNNTKRISNEHDTLKELLSDMSYHDVKEILRLSKKSIKYTKMLFQEILLHK